MNTPPKNSSDRNLTHDVQLLIQQAQQHNTDLIHIKTRLLPDVSGALQRLSNELRGYTKPLSSLAERLAALENEVEHQSESIASLRRGVAQRVSFETISQVRQINSAQIVVFVQVEERWTWRYNETYSNKNFDTHTEALMSWIAFISNGYEDLLEEVAHLNFIAGIVEEGFDVPGSLG